MEQEVTATDSDGHMVKRMLCSTKNVLPAYYVPGILRGARDSTMKKMDRDLYFYLNFLVVRDR